MLVFRGVFIFWVPSWGWEISRFLGPEFSCKLFKFCKIPYWSWIDLVPCALFGTPARSLKNGSWKDPKYLSFRFGERNTQRVSNPFGDCISRLSISQIFFSSTNRNPKNLKTVGYYSSSSRKFKDTHPKLSTKIYHPKRKVVFQPSLFRGNVKLCGCK